jgi:hypothetical protein
MLDPSDVRTVTSGPASRSSSAILRAIIRNVPRVLMQARTNVAWTLGGPTPAAHELPSRLIVSVTSYPRRFRTLALTLKCLLSQTIAPDAVVLWIAHDDKEALPVEVLALQRVGLTIEYTDDLKSFKKIIPALRRFSNAFVVTADDDIYYWPTWLEEFVKAYSPVRREILCHRLHKIRLGTNGIPLPYNQWEFEYNGTEASPLLFPTGAGGVFYPPGHLHPDVLDDATFRILCPTTDDAWLYWMARRAGSQFRKTELSRPMMRWPGSSPRFSMIAWPGSQKVSLNQTNIPEGGGNDVQIGNLIDRFGFPPQ